MALAIAGAGHAFICLSATVSATQIPGASWWSGGFGYNTIVVATFRNVSAVGAIAYSVPDESSAPTVNVSTSVTTTQTASLVLGCAFVVVLSTYTPTSGTVKTSAFSPGSAVCGAVAQTLSVPAIGTATISGSGTENPNFGVNGRAAWAIELKS
jgi:hypothetical protein